MAFEPKTDWLGLATDDLLLKSNSDGASNGNLEIVGKKGDIICNETYGHIKSPTCEYVIKGVNDSYTMDLGKCWSDTYPYALQSYTITTGAGQEPTFSATGVQIEDNTDRTTFCQYVPSGIKISPARHASDFGVLQTWTESCSMTLQNSTYTAEAEISPSTINGDPVASDAVRGKETVQLTFWTNSDTTPPSVTANTGWRQTADWSCTGADSSMFTWTATFEKYLTSHDPV